MSYDFYIFYRGTDHCLWDRNHTSNVAPMWRLAGVDLREFDGQITDDLVVPLTAAIAAMEGDPAKYRELNPSNGWGSYESCLSLLRDFKEQCEKFTGEPVTVSW